MANLLNAPKVGLKFPSYQELGDFLVNYQKKVHQTFTTYSSRKIEEPLDSKTEPKLVYCYLEYRCKFSDPASDSVANERKTRTCKLNCKAYIKLKMTSDKKYLIIYDQSLIHNNHPYSQMFFAAIPENRRLSPKSKHEVEEMCTIGGNNQLIKSFVLENKKKLLTNKDISNIRAGTKAHYKNNLTEAIELLKNKHGCTVHVLCNDEKYFKGLYFSNESMRVAMSLWPEIVFVDDTYSLVDLDLTLMVLLIEDGNGRSEVVGSALIDSEDSESLQWFANCFKKENLQATSKIKCFMTDKDMIECSVFKKTFSGVEMYLCLFHTLKTFRRVVNSKEMDLQKSEKNEILLLLMNLVYSANEVDYNEKYEEFLKSRSIKIIEYYNKNWHHNRHQWLKYSMVKGNYNNATNNRLESINAKIKAVVGRRKPLSIFVDNYFKWYKSHIQENDFVMAQQFLKKPILKIGDETARYSTYLTNFAF